MLRHFETSQLMLDAVRTATPRIVNLAVILLAVFYIYTVVGLHLLPYLKEGQKISSYMNFRSLGKSVVTLVTIASKESLSPILEDAVMQLSPQHICERLFTYQDWQAAGFVFVGCGRIASYFYFFTYMVTFVFTLMSLFGAVLIHELDQAVLLASGSVKPDDIRRFFGVWTAFDRKRVGMLPWKTAYLALQCFTLGQDPRDIKPRTHTSISLWMVEELWKTLTIPLYRDNTTQVICVSSFDLIMAFIRLQNG